MGEDVNKTKNIMNERQSRIRQYPVGHKGPLIVNIRTSNDIPLESKKIHKFVFENFLHVLEIIQVNEHKLKIVFEERAKNVALQLKDGEISSMEVEAPPTKSAREEANELPKRNELTKNYRVYIPAKYVEINGVISVPKNESVEDFVKYGAGKFVNPYLDEIKILEAVRLMKKVDGSENASTSNQLEPTGIVVITFEGTVRPNTVNLNNWLIPVKEFRIKKMFCEKCKRYNHTEKFCNNKKVTIPNDIKCLQCKTSNHASGDLKCPKRIEMEKKAQKAARNERRKTVAEMLKDLDPQNVMPNELESDMIFPPLTGATRKRRANTKANQKSSTYASVVKSPERKKLNLSETLKAPPPGFINPIAKENELVEGIVDFIRSIINDMEIPPFAKGIVEKFFLPYVHKIVEKLTNSVMQKINATSQWMETPAE
jgi:hypothetical protein